VVLFDHIIEVLALAQANSAWEAAFRFQSFYGRWIGRVLVDVDDAGARLPGQLRALRKKRLAPAASRLAVSRNSIVCPVESTARYRYLASPFTFI
jgi:hypothetical protein